MSGYHRASFDLDMGATNDEPLRMMFQLGNGWMEEFKILRKESAAGKEESARKEHETNLLREENLALREQNRMLIARAKAESASTTTMIDNANIQQQAILQPETVETDFDELRTENSNLRKEKKEMQKAKEEMQKEKEEMQEAKEEMQKEKEEMQKKLDDVTRGWDGECQTVADLQCQIRELEINRDRDDTERIEHRDEIHEKNEKIERLEADLADCRHEIGLLEESHRSIIGQRDEANRRLEQALSQRKNHMSQMEENIGRLQDDNARNAETIMDQGNVINQLDEEHKHAQQEKASSDEVTRILEDERQRKNAILERRNDDPPTSMPPPSPPQQSTSHDFHHPPMTPCNGCTGHRHDGSGCAAPRQHGACHHCGANFTRVSSQPQPSTPAPVQRSPPPPYNES